MNKKKGPIITAISLLVLLIILIIIRVGMPYVLPIKSNVVWNNNPVTKREEILLEFIDKKLTDKNGGIKTNYLNESSEGDITKGDSVLSESEGMMLMYYLQRNNQDLFDKTLKYIEDNLFLENNLVSWRNENGVKAKSSATIDDLRIVKALLLADEKWNRFKYRNLAIKISNSIYKNLKEENILVDFSDEYGKSNKVTLCYIDIPTLKYLTDIDFKWKYVYSESLKILNGGFISKDVPLYRKYYDLTTKEYDKENADTLLSLIILLNKAEAKEEVSDSVEWLKNKFKKDKAIYAYYNPSNGKSESNIESTSIYALLLRLATEVSDKELYNLALNKLNSYQILDKKSEIYGGFGDVNTLQVYSFDNLNALLAYRDVKE